MTADVLSHLALVLSASDLARRIQGRDDDPGALLGPVLRLAARALSAERASLFLVSGASADDEGEPVVLRVARVGTTTVPEVAMFVPRVAQPVFACLSGEAPSFEGPVRADDPFYREHAGVEPDVPPEVAWVPVFVHGVPRAAVELARTRPFGEEDVSALVDLGLAITRALELRGNGAFVRALLDLLPELGSPAALAQRIDEAVSQASTSPDERRAAALAVTLAELARESPKALELAATVLSATRRAFVREGGGEP